MRNGKWYYRTRVNGVLHRESLSKYGVTTKAQARAYLKEMEQARLDPSQISLAAFREQFMEERRGHIADTSLDRYRVALKVLEDDLGPQARLRSLTTRKIGQWASLRLAKGIKPAAVNADLRHIKAALRLAAK